MKASPVVAGSRSRGRLGAGVLGLAVALSTATQLRISSAPFGPGELVLTLLAAWTSVGIIISGRIQVSRPLMLLLVFWLPALALLAIGWMAGLALDRSSLANGRDLVAMGFVSFVFILWVAREGNHDFLPVAEVTFAAGGIAALTGLIALWFIAGDRIGSVSIWYGGTRFRGWAENPNQLALLVLPMPVILARRAGRATGAARWGWAFLLLWAVILGLSTRSDALMLSWAIMAASWLGLALVRAMAAPTTSILRAGSARVLLPLSLLAGAVFGGGTLLQKADDLAIRISLEGGQGHDRILRWTYGVDALAESPLLGLGPGAFSGPSGPFQEEEAHSTPIDWAASTGVLGLLLLTLFQLSLVLWAGRREDFGDLILLGGLITFSLFHYVLRQPVYWFVALVTLARAVPQCVGQQPLERG